MEGAAVRNDRSGGSPTGRRLPDHYGRASCMRSPGVDLRELDRTQQEAPKSEADGTEQNGDPHRMRQLNEDKDYLTPRRKGANERRKGKQNKQVPDHTGTPSSVMSPKENGQATSRTGNSAETRRGKDVANDVETPRTSRTRNQ